MLRPVLTDWQTILDVFFKLFSNSLRSKLVNKVLEEAFEAEWGHREIVSRILVLRTELKKTSGQLEEVLRGFLAHILWHIWPKDVYDVWGSCTDPH